MLSPVTMTLSRAVKLIAGAMADAIIEARQGQADVTEEVAEAEAEATEE